MDIKEQLVNVDPSAKDALFRRLMREEDLAYLREDNTIFGFEVDIEKSAPFSGYALIGMRKHTILVYRSDLHEEKRLVLFPSMEVLFDESFELLNLTVTKKLFDDYTFDGTPIESGRLRDVVADLTPPMKNIDLPNGVSEAMVSALLSEEADDVDEVAPKIEDKPVAPKKPITPIKKRHVDVEPAVPRMDAPPMDVPPMDVPFDNFDTPDFTEFEDGGFGGTSFDVPDFDTPDFDVPDFDAPDFDTPDFDAPDFNNPSFDEPQVDETPQEPVHVDSRITELTSQKFEKFQDVSEYVVSRFGFDSAIVNQVATGALGATADAEQRITVMVQLLVRLMENGKL